MVNVGGYRPVDGGLFYTNNVNNYEYTLLDLRSRMLETQNIRTRQSYQTVAYNYGNLDEEMRAERNTNVRTPNSNAAYTNNGLGAGIYNLQNGTPLFIESMFTNSVRYVGLVANGSNATTINYGTDQSDVFSELTVGQEVEINGEIRTVTAVILPTPPTPGSPPTPGTPGTISLGSPLSAAPPMGSLILIKGRDYVNPHLSETYRVTDKFGSFVTDENRYQVDRINGLVRYRPSAGTLATSVWHPAAQVGEAYYFGKMIPVTVPPQPAGPATDGVVGNEELGNPVDPIAPNALPTVQTAFVVAPPDGQFSNIRVTAPAGVSFEVELNGAKLAVVGAGGTVTIPFFDPNHQNDQLKANEGIDPDVYIQRFIKAGNNHLAIKATQTTSAAGANGIRVEGIFNGVDLTTANAPTSVNTLDWSASRHSVLGIVGKVDFKLGDRIALEDVNDEIQKAQGVLESLTTIIAGTDVNQFESIFSVIR